MPAPFRQELDTTITDVVYLDIGYCPAGANVNRTLGDSSVCKTTDALGRIIIGEDLSYPSVLLWLALASSLNKGDSLE